MPGYSIPELHIDSSSPFGSKSTRIAAYTTIYQRIEKLELEAKLWKKRQNALGFTCRLPHEILVLIFRCVAHAERGEEGARQLRWIERVTHICSHWRQVALESPRLWSDIPLIHSRWASEMTKRAKTAHLTIEAELGLQRFGHTQELLKYLPQVQHLTVIDATPVDDHSSFHSSLSDLKSGPFLETCHIRGIRHSYQARTISRRFLKDAPKLRSLCLEHYSLSWTSPLLSAQLTTLELIKTPHRVAPTLHELVTALDQTPSLEHFVLSFVLHGEIGETIHNTDLPQLQYLEIDASCGHCLQFLQHLSHSSTTSIKLHLLPPAPLNVSAFLSILSDLGDIIGRRMQPVSYLEVKNWRASYFEIRAWDFDRLRGQQQSPLTVPGDIPRINIHMDTSGPRLVATGRRVRAMGTLWSAMPIQKLQTLVVYNTKMTATQWVNYFGTLDSIEGLQAVRYGSGLLGALSSDIPRTFTSLKWLIASDWYSSRDNVDAQALAVCLRERQERGMGISKLHLRLLDSSNLGEESLGRIHEEVEDFKWDNLDPEFNESDDEESDEYESNDEDTGDDENEDEDKDDVLEEETSWLSDSELSEID